MTQGMILYADGGVRPVNPGNAGWGIHGYLYSTDVPKKASGAPDYVLTAKGYVSKAAANENDVIEVTPIHYIDGYGSMAPPISNNVAELAAAINGLRHALEYDIKDVQVYTDSEYVRKGLESWADGWKANNWLKNDMTPPANVEYWKELVTERDNLVNRGVKVKINWVKGHSDKLDHIENIIGNILADKLATIGVMGSLQGEVTTICETSVAEGYWKYNTNRHPFLFNRRMYFNTMPEYLRTGEYYLGDHGKDDDLLGKRISDGAYALVKLDQPDSLLELIRNYQVALANNEDTIMMARLDQLYKPGIHQDINKYGIKAVERVNKYRLDLSCLDREPLTRELKPPKLAMRAVEAISELAEKLHLYTTNSDSLTLTDLTPILYEMEHKTNKKNIETITCRLKPEYNVGYAALKVDASYKSTDGIKAVPVTLTLGIDLLDRNALKRLEETNPKVTLITWLEAPTIFRYATVIESGNDKGIWAGYYSNTRIISS